MKGEHFYNKHVFLGHRRLSVVDLETRKTADEFFIITPWSITESCIITDEIREELLDKGYTFKGTFRYRSFC